MELTKQELLLTQVTPTKQGRLALFFDGEFAFSVEPETFAALHLCQGGRYSREEFDNLWEETQYLAAKTRAFQLLSYKPYTALLLRQRLERDFSPQSVDRVLERLTQLGMLNDLDYAQRCARDLVLRKGWSPRRAALELRQRGVSPQEIAQALDQFEQCDPQEQIARLLSRKYPAALGGEEKPRRRAVNALLRLGYHYSDIHRVLERLEEDPEYYRREEPDEE